MFRRTLLATSALGVGLMLGMLIGRAPSPHTAHAQEAASADQPNRALVQGHGRATSSSKPHESERFRLSNPHDPRYSFDVVPAGKKFVLTDVMYIAQGSVRQDLVVNIANAYPSLQKHSILFQVRLSPGESDDVHLCSGYVIPAGSALIAFTNAGLEPGQYVSVSVTGYLADE